MRTKKNIKVKLLILINFTLILQPLASFGQNYRFSREDKLVNSYIAESFFKSTSYNFGAFDIYYFRFGTVSPHEILISENGVEKMVKIYKQGNEESILVDSSVIRIEDNFIFEELKKRLLDLNNYTYYITDDLDKTGYYQLLSFYVKGNLYCNILTKGFPILEFSKYNLDLSKINDYPTVEKLIKIFTAFNKLIYSHR